MDGGGGIVYSDMDVSGDFWNIFKLLTTGIAAVMDMAIRKHTIQNPFWKRPTNKQKTYYVSIYYATHQRVQGLPANQIPSNPVHVPHGPTGRGFRSHRLGHVRLVFVQQQFDAVRVFGHVLRERASERNRVAVVRSRVRAKS